MRSIMMQSFKYIIVLLIFLVACSIRPDPRYTRARPVTRKENKPVERKQTSKPYSSKKDDQSSEEQQRQNDTRKRFALEIQKFIGAPYVWGGASPAGTDCSGMVRTVYRKALGVELPRNTNELYEYGYSVSTEELQLGDLVFFRESRNSEISHVGIYLDQGKFVHASLSAGVIISELYQPWYSKIFLGARRVVEEIGFD